MSKLIYFKKTLNELEAYTALPIVNNRDRAGIIQAFEFTFEQAWKAVQKIAADQGTQIGNPRNAMMYAINNQWLSPSDEQLWLELIKDRNLTTHTYQQELATEVIERIKSHYLKMFRQLLESLENV